MKIYTDGSQKGEAVGYGIVYVNSIHQPCRCLFHNLPVGHTHQQAELLAVYYALDDLPKYSSATLLSDSQYVVESMNVWAFDWLGRALRLHDMAIFKNDTIPTLWHLLRTIIGPNVPLALESGARAEIANQDIWEDIWSTLYHQQLDITFAHVPGHSGDFFNQLAHDLAQRGCELPQ